MDQSIASGGVIPRDSIKSTTSDSLSAMTADREGSQQLNPIQIQEMTEVTPGALHTRRCRQQTADIRKNDDEGDLFQATNHRNKDNKLIRHLKAKIQEQKTSIIKMSSLWSVS